MSDPRELGLPPADGAPIFLAGERSLHEVYARHTRRRRKRFAAAGSAGVAAAAAVVALVVANGSGGLATLEQDQPGHDRPQVSAGPTTAAAPTKSPDAGPSTAPALRTPDANVGGQPQGRIQPGPRSGGDSTSTTGVAAPDSSPVRRDRTTLADYGTEGCRYPAIQGWEESGWCFVAADVGQLTAGHTVTLTVSLCRTGTASAQVRFPARQQAGWALWAGHRILWSSNEQPSSFTPGEVVTLAPDECLRWRVAWRVTAHGRPVPDGSYRLLWGTGADLRSTTGHAYHDESAVYIASG